MLRPMDTQWRTFGTVRTATDTLLTNYKPADLSASVVAAKVANVEGFTAIALRAFGRATAALVADVIFTGFGPPNSLRGYGMGHRLWKGRLTLGSKATGVAPQNDDKWNQAVVDWLEVDDWDHTVGSGYNPVSATKIRVANQESILLLPTLNYATILMEVAPTTLTMLGLGVLWRPAFTGGIIQTF